MTAAAVMAAGAIIAALATAVYAYLGISKTLRVNKPVTDATAQEKHSATNAKNLEAQQGVINTLSAQIERQDSRLTKQDERAASQDERIAALEAGREESEKQADMAARAIERGEEAARTARESLRACREQNRLLTEIVRQHWAEYHNQDGLLLPPAFHFTTPRSDH